MLNNFTFIILQAILSSDKSYLQYRLNRLTTTVRDKKYLYTMIWADNAIDN